MNRVDHANDPIHETIRRYIRNIRRHIMTLTDEGSSIFAGAAFVAAVRAEAALDNLANPRGVVVAAVAWREIVSAPRRLARQDAMLD
jgi:hypothetical protein